MRLGFCFGSFLLGGSQTQAIELMEALSGHHDVRFAILNQELVDGDLLRRIEKFEKMPAAKLLDWGNAVHFDGSGSMDTWRTLYPFAKKIVWFHGSARRTGLGCLLSRGKWPAGVTHVSTSQYVARNLPVPSDVIYFVDTKLFSPKPDTSKEFDIAILGRIRPIKNHELFLEIATEGGFSFLVVGGSSRNFEGHMNATERTLRDAARPGEGGDLVTGMIPQEQVPLFVRRARVGVVTSRSEGLGPNAQMMACGLPVVARRSGGIVESYPDATRWLTLGRNARVKDYVDVIGQALQTPTLGAKLREHVVQKYSLEGAVAKYETLYSKVSGN